MNIVCGQTDSMSTQGSMCCFSGAVSVLCGILRGMRIRTIEGPLLPREIVTHLAYVFAATSVDDEADAVSPEHPEQRD